MSTKFQVHKRRLYIGHICVLQISTLGKLTLFVGQWCVLYRSRCWRKMRYISTKTNIAAFLPHLYITIQRHGMGNLGGIKSPELSKNTTHTHNFVFMIVTTKHVICVKTVTMDLHKVLNLK